MSETVIPTTELRLVRRQEPYFNGQIGGPALTHKVQVLQQCFLCSGGSRRIWRDVPIVDEPKDTP